jgi:exopolysaccharide biosynthesis polyprenyl glycosylphosphotransferase
VRFAVLGWGWVTVTLAAALLRATVRIGWRLLVPRDRTLVVGAGELAQTVRRKIELLPQLHQEIVGTCAPEEMEHAIAAGTLPADLDRILVASRSLDESAIAMLVGLCRREGMKLSVVPPGQTHLGGGVQLSRAADLPVLDYNTWDASRSTLALKRALDLVLGSLTLAVMAPVMALTALAILLDSGRPVLFRQRRVGHDGRTFRIVKFRTMCTDAEERLAELVDADRLPEPVFKLRFDPRITRVGRVLRRFSLDELPQLVNVLRGQMSLVGPRPEQIELVERWGAEQEVRLRVRPGMTGPMQIYGRGELTLVERLAVERDYVENLSLRRDLKILALTLPAVLAGRGAF